MRLASNCAFQCCNMFFISRSLVIDYGLTFITEKVFTSSRGITFVVVLAKYTLDDVFHDVVLISYVVWASVL